MADLETMQRTDDPQLVPRALKKCLLLNVTRRPARNRAVA